MAASYPAVGELMGESGWHEGLEAEELADVLRSTMREEYADASDEEMGDALETVLDSMSPAEAFSFGSALNQIGKSASRLASDPAFIQVVRTAAPIVRHPRRASRPRLLPSRLPPHPFLVLRRRPHQRSRRPYPDPHLRWQEARRRRRRPWCSHNSPMCCGACWRRPLASTAASRSAAFLPHR